MKDKTTYLYSLHTPPQIQVFLTPPFWNLGCFSGFKFTVAKQRLQRKLQWPPWVLSKCFRRHMKQDQSLSTQQAGGCKWKMKSKNQNFLLSCWETRKDHQLPEALLPALSLWQRQYRCLPAYCDPGQKGSTERLIQFMWTQKWKTNFSQVRKPDLCVWIQRHQGLLI